MWLQFSEAPEELADAAAHPARRGGGGDWRLDGSDLARLEAVQVARFDGAGFKRSEGKFVGYGEKKWSLD